MYEVIKIVKEDSFAQLGLEQCLLEDELNKVSLKSTELMLFGYVYTVWSTLHLYFTFGLVQILIMWLNILKNSTAECSILIGQKVLSNILQQRNTDRSDCRVYINA